MNKKQVLASLTAIANRLDDSGNYESADALTEVLRRLAQYDDYDYDFGHDNNFERDDDYNVYEERQLDLDRMHERNEEENGGSYDSEAEAMEAIRRQQAEYGNEPYVMLIDYDGDDDRNTSYDIMPLNRYEENGHWMQLYKDVGPATPEELAPYVRDFETETPLGMELDSGFDDFGNFD
jgi:cobalamin biosynthesis protein CobT